MRDEVYVRTVLQPSFGFARGALLGYLLEANLAHVLTLARAGLLDSGRAAALARACGEMMEDPERLVPSSYDPSFEDLFFVVEATVQARVGEDAAGDMHLGMSRNDLDAAVFRMSARACLARLAALVDDLRATLLARVEREAATIMLAHTHGQQAQPTTLGHYLAAAEAVLGRYCEKLAQAWARTNLSPLGAAALAGSGFRLDRLHEAGLLGFEGLVENTYDAVSAVDYALEVSCAYASLAADLGRLVCDLMFWASNEVGALALDPALLQISSIMPQKRNPVALEHVRAMLSRVASASAVAVATVHNVPLGDVNDAGEHLHEVLRVQCARLADALDLLGRVLSGARFDAERLLAQARSSFSTSSELADSLVRCDRLSFRAAHRIVSRLVDRLAAHGRSWASLALSELDEEVRTETAGRPTSMTHADLRLSLDPVEFVSRRSGVGGPAPQALGESLERARQSHARSREFWRAKDGLLRDYREALEDSWRRAARC